MPLYGSLEEPWPETAVFSTRVNLWLYRMVLLPKLLYVEVIWCAATRAIEYGTTGSD